MAMVIKRELPIDIHTTPEELRRLADRMEAFRKKVNIGDDTLLETWHGYSQDNAVCLNWRLEQ